MAGMMGEYTCGHLDSGDDDPCGARSRFWLARGDGYPAGTPVLVLTPCRVHLAAAVEAMEELGCVVPVVVIHERNGRQVMGEEAQRPKVVLHDYSQNNSRGK